MRRSELAVAIAAGLVVLAPTLARGDDPRLLNPFGDPFVQATSGRACPAPLGPAYSEAERRIEAHSRAERGTTCWLAGLCAEPNASATTPPTPRPRSARWVTTRPWRRARSGSRRSAASSISKAASATPRRRLAPRPSSRPWPTSIA